MEDLDPENTLELIEARFAEGLDVTA